MSKALRCDRCGAYYRPEREEETCYISRISWRNAESVKNQKTLRSLNDLDLCADCTEDLEYFLNGYPLAVRETENEKDRNLMERLERERIEKNRQPRTDISSLDNDDD